MTTPRQTSGATHLVSGSICGAGGWLSAEAGDGRRASCPSTWLMSRLSHSVPTGEGRPRVAARLWMLQGRDLSRFPHGLDGRYETVASMPDVGQDAGQRIDTPAHGLHAVHVSRIEGRARREPDQASTGLAGDPQARRIAARPAGRCCRRAGVCSHSRGLPSRANLTFRGDGSSSCAAG